MVFLSSPNALNNRFFIPRAEWKIRFIQLLDSFLVLSTTMSSEKHTSIGQHILAQWVPACSRQLKLPQLGCSGWTQATLWGEKRATEFPTQRIRKDKSSKPQVRRCVSCKQTQTGQEEQTKTAECPDSLPYLGDYSRCRRTWMHSQSWSPRSISSKGSIWLAIHSLWWRP